MVESLVGKRQRPLDEVAGMLGFSGLSTFSRWFRNRFGQSASEWRAVKLRSAHANAALRGQQS
jgi:AraC-like DNA-binding protein